MKPNDCNQVGSGILLMRIFVGLWSDRYCLVVGDVFLYFAHTDHFVFGVGEEEYGKVVGEPDGWINVADSSYLRVHLRLQVKNRLPVK